MVDSIRSVPSRLVTLLGLMLALAGVSEILGNVLEQFRMSPRGVTSLFSIAPGSWRLELIGVLIVGVSALVVGIKVLDTRAVRPPGVARMLAPVFAVLPLLLLTVGVWESPASLKPDTDFGLGAGTFALLTQVVAALIASVCALGVARSCGLLEPTIDRSRVALGVAASICVVSFLFVDGWYRLDTHVIPVAQRVELFGARLSSEWPAGVIGGWILLAITLGLLTLMTFGHDRRVAAWTALGLAVAQVLVYADDMRRVWWSDAAPGWGGDVHANGTVFLLVAGVVLLGTLSISLFARGEQTGLVALPSS